MNKKLIGTNTQTSNLVTRIKSLEAIMAHRADLMNHDWQDVYGDDTHQSYDAFLEAFLLF